jgi:hypothetical protein
MRRVETLVGEIAALQFQVMFKKVRLELEANFEQYLAEKLGFNPEVAQLQNDLRQ